MQFTVVPRTSFETGCAHWGVAPSFGAWLVLPCRGLLRPLSSLVRLSLPAPACTFLKVAPRGGSALWSVCLPSPFGPQVSVPLTGLRFAREGFVPPGPLGPCGLRLWSPTFCGQGPAALLALRGPCPFLGSSILSFKAWLGSTHKGSHQP